MAIYISGVKGLPEQVQANKEDIAQIKEDIANIDFDAIRELEAQVGENTQDINNLENGQGVQDQAINGLGDRVGTAEGKITQLETDTQKITYNATDDETRIQGTTRIAVIKNNRIGDDDSIITFGTANGIELRQGTHIMNYDDDGLLWLDGVQITPTPVSIPRYQHNLHITKITSTRTFYFTATIINYDNTAIDILKLKSYLTTNGLTAYNKVLLASGFSFNVSDLTEEVGVIMGIYNDNTQNVLYATASNPLGHNDTNYVINTPTITDTIIEI